MPTPNSQFPTKGILPKDEIEVTTFLKKYPNYDGRGIVVAIFDTGIDVGNEGLRVTSDGKTKIIDSVDCTGSGDVDCSTIVEPSSDGFIVGLTGKKLKVGKDWKNPTNKYHIGMKRVYELFPKSLVERLEKDTKKDFSKKQNELIENLSREIQNAKEDVKKELELRLEQLKEMYKKYKDYGPIVDCVVFHDGDVWRAVVDTTEDGDLSKAKVLTDYYREQQYATFSEKDLMNYCVNIYENGNILSIVTPSGDHGTHVAGIVAGYYPKNPELNGIAPGAQIVNVKIGDTRLGTMETGTGIVRGIIAAQRSKVHLCNMSYGEATKMPNKGRINKLMSELVNKYNVIFCGSAGNSGPALSTVGAPGGSATALIGVGAYVSPPMMLTEYSMLEELPETHYTWTSRGPQSDGDFGVSISAPGGAIAPVPTYTLKKNQLKNGTSMASPSACGGIALILSGLKANNAKWNPHIVRRAVENTARNIEGADVFALGRGLIQVQKAYEYLEKYPFNEKEDFRIEVSTSNKARGVYLREPFETKKPTQVSVTVKTIFHEDAPNTTKIEYEKRVLISATQPWIQAPKYVVLSNGCKDFTIKVDPTKFPQDSAGFGEVIGLDADYITAGPLFRCPVTIIKPLDLNGEYVTEFKEMKFKPGSIQRHFIAVPEGSNFAEITIDAKEIDTVRTFCLHAVQLLPDQSHADNSKRTYFKLTSLERKVLKIKVEGGYTMEVCLAQYWSSLGQTEVDMRVEFHGVQSHPITLKSEQLVTKAIVKSPLRNEELSVSARLNWWKKSINPNSSKISTPTDTRDFLPNGRPISEMILTYSFTLSEQMSVKVKVPVLHDLFYESKHEAQMFMIFNKHKQRLNVGDAWPKEVKLEKGSYVVRLQIRHENLSQLERLKNLPIILEHKIKEIQLALHKNINTAFTAAGTKAKTKEKVSRRLAKLEKGKSTHFYISAPDFDSLPKCVSPGDVLSGSVNFFRDKSFGSVSIDYIVQLKKTKPETPPKPSEEDKRTPEEKFDAYILEQKIKYLEKLLNNNKRAEFVTFMKSLLESHPKNLDLLKLNLKSAFDEKERDEEKLIKLCDEIISNIDTSALAIHLGTRTEKENQVDKEMKKQKEVLIETLSKKLQILTEDEKRKDEMKTCYEELKKWVDTQELKYAHLDATVNIKLGKYGEALKTIHKHISKMNGEPQEKQLYELRCKIVEQLGWNHWSEYFSVEKHVLFPQSYPLF